MSWSKEHFVQLEVIKAASTSTHARVVEPFDQQSKLIRGQLYHDCA